LLANKGHRTSRTLELVTMNIVHITIVLALAVLVEAQNFDKPFLICTMQQKWMSKTTIDNKTEKERKSKGLPTESTLHREITDIYEWPEKLSYLVNLQIRHELVAFYNYLAMSRFFHKYDEDRAGFAKYFRDAASEELSHAEMFMKYQQMRGGDVLMWNLPQPTTEKWRNAKDVLVSAYMLEKKNTDEIMCLHKLATDKYPDTDFLTFLEDKIIPEQHEGMKELKTMIKTLERACPGDAESQCANYPLYELQYDMKLKGGQ